MDHKADMPPEKRRKRWGCLTYILVFFLLCAGLFVLLVIDVRRECVVMPNGFLIGRATVFSDMRSPGADIALKYPDGRLFLRGDRAMDFWDQDSLAGTFYNTPEGRSDRYVYLNDVGLILKSEQPELYQFHYDRKRVLHRHPGPTSGGHIVRTYHLLHKDSDNHRSGCPTDWFWPRKAGFIPLMLHYDQKTESDGSDTPMREWTPELPR